MCRALIPAGLAGFFLCGAIAVHASGFLPSPAFLEGLQSGAPTGGHGRLALFFLIAAGTLLSEDLACIGAGLLAGAGRLDYPTATAAAFTGILLGDSLIFFLGRWLGRPVLRHRWAGWFIPERAVNRAAHLFHRHGLWIIVLTRFLPGTRTATYFTAGALHAPPVRFIPVFALAAALWTPFLVGLSFLIGIQLLAVYRVYEAFTLPALLLAILLLYLLFHYGIPMLTWRGRRQLKGKWIRATRWEFWPWWQVNWLVFLYVVATGLFRYRRPLLFTAVNPCMPHGGFLGESKSEILAGLGGAGEAIPPWRRIEVDEPGKMLGAVRSAMRDLKLDWPVVLKPDEGQRGLGVRIVRDEAGAAAWLRSAGTPAILQQFVAGKEYGIFHVRDPGEKNGRVTSITTKEQVVVTGNGSDTLEVLILRHPRAIALLDTFLARFESDLERIPADGERIALGELGTHALGAVFRDGMELLTPELEGRIDAIARTFPGFYFGRFDIIAPDEASLRKGEALRVIELNGLTSEATHIYDPRYGLLHAWSTLCGQWRTAFEIGKANHAAGAPVSSFRLFLGDFLRGMRRQKRMQGGGNLPPVERGA